MMNDVMTTAHNAMNSSMATINASHMASSIMSDDMSVPSSPESGNFDESDLLSNAVNDDVTAQLAAAGTIGLAAAAAIATGKKRKRPHSFETNPSIRKRQQTRLLRKLKATIEEYTTRVGQQAIILSCTPGKPNQSYQSFKVFGSQPLENCMRNCRSMIMQDLEAALSQQAPPSEPVNPALHELPPLVIDGIPTPVDKMTQAQLRAFIPEMLKYSSGRSKPGWGKPEYRPIWWPSDLPWANVRSDVRSEEEKKKVSWTHALRTIVKNCYKHHGRDDLLPMFGEEPVMTHPATHHYAGTMVQTINNPDGTVSIIQIDTGAQGGTVVTLADGTQATVVHAGQGLPTQFRMMHENPQHETHQAVQTLAEVASNQSDVGNPIAPQATPIRIEMNPDGTPRAITSLGEATATINHEGQLILTGGDGLTGADGTGVGIVTIPVSMYQTVVTSLQSSLGEHMQAGTMHVAMAPKQEHPNGEVPDATNAVEIMTMDQS